MHDVLIIGSGVIGMSIARHLSATHLDVAVIDRDVPGKHASYKAGGMLGAQNEFTEDSDLFQLAIESRAMFPQLSKSLLDETGIDKTVVSNNYQMMICYNLHMVKLNLHTRPFTYHTMVKLMHIITHWHY